jgi:hypothetical protein
MRSVPAAASVLSAVFSGGRRALINPLLVMLLGMAAITAVRADDLSADVTGYTDKGYGRMVFTFSQENKTSVKAENGILTIDFKRPVKIAVGDLAQRLAGYVGAVRRDPDGSAIRLALSRKVTVNVMEAGEKLFVDLLPQEWVGLPPGLPTEVVDDLAKRAREAERQAMMKRNGPRKEFATIQMRYAMAPSFARFSFELVEPVKAVSERDGQELRIHFDAPVKVDFGEVLARLPASVLSLSADYQPDITTVKLVMAPNAELRSFQENAAFIVDVLPPKKAAPPDIESLINSLPETADNAPAKGTPPSAPVAVPAHKSELAALVPAKPLPVPAAPAPAAISAPATPAVKTEKPAEPVKAAKTEPVKAVKTEPVIATITRHAKKLTLTLPFDEQVAGAMFRRGNTIWIVLDTTRQVQLAELANDASHTVRNFEQKPLPGGQLIKLKIEGSRLASLMANEAGWTIDIGGSVANPGRPIPARRVFAGKGRAGVFMPLGSPGHAYNLKDPEIGDDLVAVTATAPVRGLVREQRFVDFSALASVQGVVLAPKSDDLTVELSPEGVTVTRPEGLAVSEMDNVLPALPEQARTLDHGATALNPEAWQAERKADYMDREVELARALAEAPIVNRAEARIALARFYLARNLASNAEGVLGAGSEEELKYGSDSSHALLHGLAELEMGRAKAALRDFKNPVLAKQPQAGLLRASALSNLTRWAEAREEFNASKNAVASLPVEVQRTVLMDAMRAMISASDFGAASDIRSELDLVGIPAELKPAVAVLTARLAVGLGRSDQAASDYAEIAAGPESPAMAEARLRLIEMRLDRGSLDRANAITALETLSFAWRGDETEIETMRLLARLYVAEARYRDAFNLLDAALLVRPESENTRNFYTEMASIFEDMFLSDRTKAIDPIEALAIYYDFSKLTPIGRRGDELIRRLADRLVSVDLLDQASELLNYQVKYRLTGVAKAQVAAKLAWVDLLNNKAAAAIQALADTRMADLPQDLREQRLLLEARALSELGRYNAALELAAGAAGDEAARLRGDILWSAKRWREAGEAFERLLGDRWQHAEPLNETERRDVLRAGIAFALGNESIGLARLRDRYAAKMPDGEERAALGIMASPSENSPKLIGKVAKTLSAVDSLKLFLKLYQARFPDKPLPAETASVDTKKVSAR